MSQPVMHDEKAEVIDLNADVAVAAEPEAGHESSTSVLSEALASRKEGIADTTLGDLTPDQPIKDARTASSILALLRDDLGTSEILNERAVRKDGFAVVVYPSKKPDQYVEYQETVVRKVLEEYDFQGEISYLVRFADGQEEQLLFDDLVEIEGGPAAIRHYNEKDSDESSSMSSGDQYGRRHDRQIRSRTSHSATISSLTASLADDTEDSDEHLSGKLSASRRRQRQPGTNPIRRQKRTHISSDSLTSESGTDVERVRAHRTRGTARKRINYSDLTAIQVSDDSDEPVRLGKRKRGRPSASSGNFKPGRSPVEGTRKSGRNVLSANMQEIGEEDIPEQAAKGTVAKFVGAAETFKQLAGNDDFRLRHCQTCDTCNAYGNSQDRGNLVYCQSCSLSYHQKCLGPRNTRDHLVTKIGQGDFVLQCKRCLNVQRHKENTAPDQARCLECKEPSIASQPFRERKNSKQEQKEREENNGEDPIAEVHPNLINNADNVLFRCLRCYRACHYHHLPPTDGKKTATEIPMEYLADERFSQYSKKWACCDCLNVPADVDGLAAWRPKDLETYVPGTALEVLNEDDKDYLIKWKKLAYFKVTWMTGAWVWGITAPAMRKAFAKREENTYPKMSTEDAVPDDYLRVDIVFDVEYDNVVKLHTLQIDQARAKEVDRALVKFKGLGYEDVVWCESPSQEDGERWADFKTAYDDWVQGAYIMPPPTSTLSGQLLRLRKTNFGAKVKLETQPSTLTGGELMGYQLEGINWIYYQWFRKQNAILADEMGLGKTIQIIGFLATLVQLHECFPFLVVVPNSTCPNWRREVKRWAPSMRVVTYYGSSEARKLSEKYELFRGGTKALRCHVVVTSYDAAQDDEFRRVFRGVHWQGLVVDEGQRLKNDKNLLYGALSALHIPFKILLTGTPLQNNQRELFNLLQFLDSSLVAQNLEEEYTELTKANVRRLHKMLRPFFLRRTKAEVLDFLPPVAQIIVPVSLTDVQRKLYRSIFAKNPELIKSVIGDSRKSKLTERASLNNILMQLRKTLCHPFVYNRAIEQVDPNPAVAHRNFVEASSKLKLLEIMLPKLKERGHRVLIFSQFLDMLSMVEDFLDGLGFLYQRLDGSMGSLQKQKRIDEFNAPNSSLFAFLLSTRAGGVGINLASADTVIILDPDFNPHQDIQALSRAHRIGQKKKVLVFQLTTRGTVEEKIMQIGKKKMSLDHVLIDQMDAEEDAGADIESILRFGLDAIFQDDNAEEEIRYDSASVDKLLDRSQMEETLPGKDNSAESQFSFARVWANDKGILEEEGLDDDADQTAPANPSTWDAILQEREREAREEAAAKAEYLGRGRRRRDKVDYKGQDGDLMSAAKQRNSTGKVDEESDTDFMTPAEESEEDVELERTDEDFVGETSTDTPGRADSRQNRSSVANTPPSHKFRPMPHPPQSRQFKRGDLSRAIMESVGMTTSSRAISGQERTSADGPGWTQLELDQAIASNKAAGTVACIACGIAHAVGRCPLKLLGWEYCPLCSIAHFGRGNVSCPHLASETQCKLMLQAINLSPESARLKELARREVVNLLGRIRERKRRKREKRMNGQESKPADHTSGHPQAYSQPNHSYPSVQSYRGDKDFSAYNHQRQPPSYQSPYFQQSART